MKNQILKKLRNFDTLPFLFVGSGISIRYLGLENWEGLLRKFAVLAKENELAYEMYVQRAKDEGYKEGLLPKVAELIEKDFNQIWFTDVQFESNRKESIEEIRKGSSPFKIEISKYMIDNSANISEGYETEISLLKKAGEKSIGGVITTNYDLLFENLLINYERYIGQEELIFSSIQGVGEIYKIHGCCTKPDSIIINEDDYIDFEEKNAYLAAKILTIFLEHPIIFIGYSISDKNVENILKAIVTCLSAENLEKLKERLIFIERNDSEEDSVSSYSKSFDDNRAIEMTRIKIKDFSLVYEALIENKAKYNAAVLRRLKQDIYDLVLTNKPTSKMRVVGLEDDKLQDVEVVVGVGVLNDFGKKGYEGLKVEEIFNDIVFDQGNFDCEMVVQSSLPVLLKQHSKSVPIYKYIADVDFELPDIVKESVKQSYDEFLNHTLKKLKFSSKYSSYTLNQLKKELGDMKCLEYAPIIKQEYIEPDELKFFLQYILKEYPDLLTSGRQSDKTNLKRAIRILDWLLYFKKTKED